jgi:hypothetical protein
MPIPRAPLLLALAGALHACSGDTEALAPGVLGGPCYGNSTCNPGLTCVDDLCLAGGADAGALADGGAPPDGGTVTATTGVVFGRVTLSGAPDSAGVEVRIGGRSARTDAQGAFRVLGVPQGSHRLDVAKGPAPTLAPVRGRVAASSGPRPPDVHVYFQAAPAGWVPQSKAGVVVFAGQETEVEDLTLAHPAPFARHVPVDGDGTFTLEAWTGTYAGARPLQPEVGTGRYVQPTGTFALAAGTYPFVDAPQEGGEPRISGLDFSYSFEDPRGWSADPAWAWSQALVVETDGAELGEVVLYSGALLFGTEEQAFWYAGLDMSARTGVRSSSPDADVRLGDADGPFAPTRTVRLLAPGIQPVDAANMQDFLQAPGAGYAASVSLTYQTFAGVFADRALDPVYAVQTQEGDYAKLKVRYGLQGTGADTVWSVLFVLYHHEPGGSPSFSR